VTVQRQNAPFALSVFNNTRKSLLPPDLIRGAILTRRQQSMVALLAGQIGLSVRQEGLYALVAVPAHGRVPATLVHAARFAVDLVSALDDRGVEDAEAGALHDAADGNEGEQQRYEGGIGHLDGTLALGVRGVVLAVPALPIFPGCIPSRIRVPPRFV
ncbi:hypothetical protein CV019_00620, partial [Staphylococcus haemolyticus]